MEKEESKIVGKWTVAILTAVMASVATVGANQMFNNPALAERVLRIEHTVDEHLIKYETKEAKDIADQATRIAVLEQQLASIQRQLDALEEGQHRLLRAAGLNGSNFQNGNGYQKR